ncbi:MAG: exopolysaccharide biosynthesis polyprenyl glycosylphosphotransferase [Clostridiales bacterium]|nr:exopolysaccharide biosynthesis polyprenyl glycosylphosphotransferase [Clostridiales bacterium]
MKKSGEAINIFKFLSSFVIVSIHTALFSYVLFSEYNRILAAPLASGGLLMVALYLAGLIFIFNIMGALRVGYNKQFNIILSQIIGLCFINIIAYLQLSLIHRAFLPFHQIFFMTVCQVSAAIIWTLIVFAILKKKFPVMKMLLVYGDKKAEDIVYKILEREDQYMICESVRYECGNSGESNLDEVKAKISEYNSVIICQISSSVRNDLLKFCYENDIVAYLQPRISDIIVRGAKELNQFDSPLVVCKNCSLTPSQRFFKRLFDIIISLFGIIICSPLMIITSLAIKIYDGGPVFFKQKRVTINERLFYIYKFRSMITDAEKDNRVIPASDNDPRITPVGRIIRKLRIDELPQLFNILKGDMSFVGPRPERVENHLEYTKQIPEFAYRCKVKAGLTGYAQVMGKYNTSPYDKLLLDLAYIQKFSFFLDFSLILLTVKVVFMKESTEGFKDN